MFLITWEKFPCHEIWLATPSITHFKSVVSVSFRILCDWKVTWLLKNVVDCPRLLSSKLHGKFFCGCLRFHICTLIGESLREKKVFKDVSRSRLFTTPIHQSYSCRISFHKSLSFRSWHPLLRHLLTIQLRGFNYGWAEISALTTQSIWCKNALEASPSLWFKHL